MAYFKRSTLDPPFYGFLGVLSALVEAVFQFSDGRGEDEQADRIRELLPDLQCTLPVDFKQDIVAGMKQFEDLDPGSAIVVVMDKGMLKEFTCLDAFPEGFNGCEMIFPSVHFARPWLAGGGGDGQPDCRVGLEQRSDE